MKEVQLKIPIKSPHGNNILMEAFAFLANRISIDQH